MASYSPWGRKESGPTEWLSKAQQGLRQDFPGGSVIKNPPTNAGDKEVWVQFLGREDPLESEMATYSSNLAWKIPGTEEDSGIQSTGSQRVRHD